MHTKFSMYEGLTLIEIRSRYKSESGRGSAVFGPFFVQNFRHDCLAQNASFADLGAPKACQSVALSVKLTKTRHSGRMFEQKTARKRPKRGLGAESGETKIDPNRKFCLESFLHSG